MLIDGGPGDVVISKLGSVMPFWDRAIDDVLLTHPHADHLDGLVDVVDRYRVSRVYISGVDFYTPLGPEFYARVSDGETVIDVTRPQEIDLGGGVILRLLYTTSSLVGRQIDDANASSLVGLLTYGETSVLLTGDITAEREAEIAVQLDAPVDVLKVAHHGSAYSSTMDFPTSPNRKLPSSPLAPTTTTATPPPPPRSLACHRRRGFAYRHRRRHSSYLRRPRTNPAKLPL